MLYPEAVQRTLVLLVTTLALLASLLVVPLLPARAKRGDAAIGAARLVTVSAAEPAVAQPEPPVLMVFLN